MFYRGHMRYLRENKADEVDSILTPPDEFRTKRQIKNLKQVGNKNAAKPDFTIKFQKKQEEETTHVVHHNTRFRKAANVIQDMVMLEHFSSNHERDWVMRTEAGVIIWINKGTGEVSTIRPWDDAHSRVVVSAPSSDSGGARSAGQNRRSSRLGTMFNVGTSGNHNDGNAMRPKSAAPIANRGRFALKLQAKISEGNENQHLTDLPSTESTAVVNTSTHTHTHDHTSTTAAVPEEDDEEEMALGTGARVYQSEMDEFFALLDSQR